MMKEKMWKQFTAQNSTEWVSVLPKLLTEYNNTKHRSISMTPTEASEKKNEGTVYFNLYGDMRRSSTDKVRISKYKRKVFDK